MGRLEVWARVGHRILLVGSVHARAVLEVGLAFFALRSGSITRVVYQHSARWATRKGLKIPVSAVRFRLWAQAKPRQRGVFFLPRFGLGT